MGRAAELVEHQFDPRIDHIFLDFRFSLAYYTSHDTVRVQHLRSTILSCIKSLASLRAFRDEIGTRATPRFPASAV
jgi:hypothetical protein